MAFQIDLMGLLSIVQWHHFASVVISLALLGFGASGTVLAIGRRWAEPRFSALLPPAMVLCGLLMPLSVALAQASPFRFDSFLLFTGGSQGWRLLATGLVFLLPFWAGALAIALALSLAPGHRSRTYAASLAGSGLGTLLAYALMARFQPERLPALIALLPLAAAALVLPSRTWAWAPGIALLFDLWLIAHPPGLVLSEFKDLRKALELPGSRVLQMEPSPYGLLQVVAAPTLRYAPGLSLGFTGPVPSPPRVYLNGDGFGPLLPWDPGDVTCILDATPSALPYALRARSRVLVLEARTGAEVVHALVRGCREVVAVEPNPQAARLLQTLPAGRRLEVSVAAPRAFLAWDQGAFDLIVLAGIDTSGLRALTEDHLLTVEGLAQALVRLSAEGALTVTCPLDQPPRHSVKLLATVVEALAELGWDPKDRVVLVRGWNTLALTVQRAPLQPEERAAARRFCDLMGFDVVLLPGVEPWERTRFHGAVEGRWLASLDTVLAGGLPPSDFNLAPARDGRPFFFQFLTWRSLPHLREQYGGRAIPFFELGYLVLTLSALLVAVLAFTLVLLPRMLSGGRGSLRTVGYFGGLGAGFMLTEMALIQAFVLPLGHPVPAAAAVLGLLLAGSGWGSWTAGQRPGSPARLFGVLVGLLLLGALLLGPLLQASLTMPLAGRLALPCLLLPPLACLMGRPFPLGLASLPKEELPWAWGINGCLSVVAASFGSLLCVELGFSGVMTLAAAAYGAAWAAGPRRF